jgi:hypothetical protein
MGVYSKFMYEVCLNKDVLSKVRGFDSAFYLCHHALVNTPNLVWSYNNLL